MGTTTHLLPVLTETSFNVNSFVKFKLTSTGVSVLMDRLRQAFDYSAPEARCFADSSCDCNGYYVLRLYEFMALFGPAMPTSATVQTADHLFEQNDIILVPNGLDVEHYERQT